jgi:predicted DNA-binding transcriptional regulator YafY
MIALNEIQYVLDQQGACRYDPEEKSIRNRPFSSTLDIELRPFPVTGLVGNRMNRIDRLTAILLQLQSRPIVPGREIAERFGISLRTVYRDIRALEDAGVPIGSEAGMGYFLAPGYHLPPVMFTDSEARALLMGGKLIEKFSDPAVNRNYACALDKIRAVMGDREKAQMDTLANHIEVLKVSPRSREGFPGDLLPAVQEVLGRRRVIRIEYTSGYRQETTRRDIEPLGLCFYGGNWHLMAFCRLRSDYRDFRVDRIRSLKTTDVVFNPSRHGDLSALISRMVHETDVKPACVRFTRKAAAFIGDQKYYFGLVEEKDMGNRLEMHFLTGSYTYMARWLLGYMEEAEVVSPDALQEILVTYSERLYAHYHGS